MRLMASRRTIVAFHAQPRIRLRRSRWTRPAPGGPSSTTSAPAGSVRRRPSGAPASRPGRSGWTAPWPRPGHRLRAGQRLTWERPPWDEPEAPVCTAVLFEDADLLAVAKPRGLPTMPGGGLYLESTLLAVVRGARPGGGARCTGWGATPRAWCSSPGPRTRGPRCSGRCGSGASARSTGRSARATPRPTPSTSTPPSARSRTRPPARSTRPRRTAGRRGATVRVLERRGGRGGLVAPRGGDRDRPPPPDPHPPGLRRPPARGRPALRRRADCPSPAASPCRATRATCCTPTGSSSPTPGPERRSRWSAHRRRCCAGAQWPSMGAIR